MGIVKSCQFGEISLYRLIKEYPEGTKPQHPLFSEMGPYNVRQCLYKVYNTECI